MMFADSSRTGVPFSKDPHVLKFNGRYFLYFSIPPKKDGSTGWGIGIAESKDLTVWKKTGEINPTQPAEEKGICAPGGFVEGGKIHLFYQTYGTFGREAICHAVSTDGINFEKDKTNPVFRPTGSWTCGRAIDAEVVKFKRRYLMYFATRDTSKKIQMVGVASAPLTTDFGNGSWKQLTDYPILKPELPWEQTCIEAPTTIERNGILYMFYAGAYNNAPQQIGVAKSEDGVKWERLSDTPFLKNGVKGVWNSSESGHPHIFSDQAGKTWLFYQGNNDKGKTWFLSNLEVKWDRRGPVFPKD